MIDKNKVAKTHLVSVTWFLNQTHTNASGVFSVVIVFGDVPATI